MFLWNSPVPRLQPYPLNDHNRNQATGDQRSNGAEAPAVRRVMGHFSSGSQPVEDVNASIEDGGNHGRIRAGLTTACVDTPKLSNILRGPFFGCRMEIAVFRKERILGGGGNIQPFTYDA